MTRTVTADEALSLLHDGEGPVHTLLGGIGADHERDSVVVDMRCAASIWLAGDETMAWAISHPVVIVRVDGPRVYCEADMAKVKAFQAARVTEPSDA